MPPYFINNHTIFFHTDNFANMNKIAQFISIIIIFLSFFSCSEKKEYNAEYAPIEGIPFNIETNSAATSSIVKVFPGCYMFRSDYPQYSATVNYGLVNIADSGSIKKVITNHFDKMADRIGIYESSIRTFRPDSDRIAWIMVTPQCKAPVQMLTTDSASIALHATMEFTSPQTDTAGVIIPAITAIAADMEHLLNNLKLH